MCNLNSNGDTTIKRLNLGCVFLGESKNGFVISIIRILHYQKKRGDPKKGSFTMTATCPCALREKKKQQQNDPRGDDKKEKQYKLLMKIRNVYISAETQLFSNRIHPRIVKL